MHDRRQMQLSQMMPRPIPFAVAALLTMTVQVEAGDPMGSAGLYRVVPVTNCAAGVLEQMQGACDPPAVDEKLPPGERIRGHLDRAQRLVLLLRMGQAREAADHALAVDPNDYVALKFRARLALNMWDDNTAWRDINAALKTRSDDSDALTTRAELRWRREEKELAIRDATAAVNADPGNTDAYRTRGRFLMIMNREMAAMADWNKALELEPNFKLVRMFRAQTYLRMAHFDDAVEDATVVLREDPFDISALQVRAHAYGASGKVTEAIADLTTMLGPPGDNRSSPAQIPNLRPLLLQRMIMLFRADREEEGRKDMDLLLESGGAPGILQLQLFLRKNGYPDVAIDGRRSGGMDSAILACTSNKACLQALSQNI